MLPTINRIKKKKDFELIFKNSKTLRSGLFIFKIAKNGLNLNRFGFVVSSRVSKKATVRNKIKRRLSALMGSGIDKIKNGTDLVIIAMPGAESQNFSEIEKNINNALVKSGLAAK